MTVSQDKTAPDAELRMGVLLRGALDAQGVAHRVGAGAVERGYLATTGHDGPPLYITAHSRHGHMDYDIPRAECIGITAVVTTSEGTRLVHDGPSAGLRPVEDAQAAARAVASFLGLQPVPFCAACKDFGLVSSDTGPRPCPDTACQVPREKAAARAAERHTDKFVTGGEEFGPQVCAECGWGGYTPVPGLYSLGLPVYVCTASGCGHTVDHSAFDLSDGERLDVHDGRLYMVRPYDGAPF